jgi:Chaperone for flagella basal body P-ring formation
VSPLRRHNPIIMHSLIFRTIPVIVACVVACATSAAVEIRLKDEAHCPGPLVRLGDIADFNMPTSAELPALADLALFPAPSTGKPRELKRQELQQLLALCEIDPRDVQLIGAEMVVIRAGSAEQKTIIRPALHLIPATAYIKSGSAQPSETPVPSSKSERLPRLVQRNQVVTIHSLWPGVKVTASGKALADGTLGEAVLIEQADSRERVLAKVIGPQTVEVRPGTN